jgi:hypothetical protein
MLQRMSQRFAFERIGCLPRMRRNTALQSNNEVYTYLLEMSENNMRRVHNNKEKMVIIRARYCRTCSQEEEGKNERKRTHHQMDEETPMALSKPTPTN